MGCIEVEGSLGGAFIGLKGQQGLGSMGFGFIVSSGFQSLVFG